MIAPKNRRSRRADDAERYTSPERAPRLRGGGRHLSITKAADELCVTVAAVSHQVKTLEDYLEVRLFRRAGNALFLTDAGQAFLPGLRAGFAELERAMDALREHEIGRAHV